MRARVDIFSFTRCIEGISAGFKMSHFALVDLILDIPNMLISFCTQLVPLSLFDDLIAGLHVFYLQIWFKYLTNFQFTILFGSDNVLLFENNAMNFIKTY